MATESMAGRHPYYRLTMEQRAQGLAQIKQQVIKHELNMTAPKIQIIGKNKKDATTVGTNRAAEVSISRYETIWRAVLDFCIEISDYDSAMLFAHDLCPTDPFPMSAEMAISCLRFHVEEKGTILKHHKTNEPIISSLTDAPMICQGDWKSVHSIASYCSALTKVHMHYETTTGEYCDLCDDCRKIPMEEVQDGKGCHCHPGQPHYWHTGKPTTAPDFQNNRGIMIDYIKTHYDAHHTFVFYPGELQDLRLYLLSMNNRYKLMIWTIMLVGIKGFLRIEEALNLEVEDLPQDYFVVTRENVEGLCMTVQGKTDEDKQYLAIWDDKECPDLSPSRALLIWLAVTGIKTGKLFPSEDELHSGTESPTESLPYEDFLKEIKFLCTNILKKEADSPAMKKMIIGTHMLRKMGYLLAYWGFNRKYGMHETTPMDQASILLSARHKDTRSCATYLSDSGTMQALCSKIRANDVNQRVGEWQPIHIETHTAFAALNVPSKQYIKSAVDLSDWYVFSKLGVPKDGELGRMGLYQIHQLACQFIPDLSNERSLCKLLEENLPSGILQEALSLISKDRNARIMEAVHHATAVQHNSLLALGTPQNASRSRTEAPARMAIPAASLHPATPYPPPEDSSRKRKYNPDEVVTCSRDFQQEVKRARTAKALQVELLQQAVSEVRTQLLEGNKILQDPLWSFAYRAGKVVDCVKNCHGGSITAFLQANEGFTYSRFKCCNGTEHSTSFDISKL